MKKILTFLVMLVASVSFLMAQAPQAKFNYQAVVRDRNNDNNLVMNRTINVTIEILNGQNVVYTGPSTEVQTNRNGMVSFVINFPQGLFESANVSEVLPGTINNQVQPTTSDFIPVQTQTIDWSNVVIRATFKDGEDTLSVVENVVMPVPLALQAAEDPMTITTQKIVNYINDSETDGNDVGEIVSALLNKTEVSNAVRDSIISYIKTQPDKVKELAIYFLGTVTVQDAKDAYDTLSSDVKQEIKKILVDSIKANKALAYQILADYLKNTSKEEVQQLWGAARANEDFHTIFNAVRDSAIAYVMRHNELVMNVAEYYIMNVLTYNDVRDIYDTLRDKNQPLYNQLKAKFDSYLQSYLGDNYVQACVVDQEVYDLCYLKQELDEAKAKALGCPDFFIQPVITPAPNEGYNITVYISGLPANTTTLTSDQFIVTKGESAVPQIAYEWTVTQNAVASYNDGYPANPGDVFTFQIEGNAIKAGCPSKTATVTVQ